MHFLSFNGFAEAFHHLPTKENMHRSTTIEFKTFQGIKLIVINVFDLSRSLCFYFCIFFSSMYCAAWMLLPLLGVALFPPSQAEDVCAQHSNGCSIPGDLSFFYKDFFKPSCDRHDACYGCVRSPSTSMSWICLFYAYYYTQFVIGSVSAMGCIPCIHVYIYMDLPLFLINM